MNRRNVLAALVALGAWVRLPVTVAQSPKAPVLGVLTSGGAVTSAQWNQLVFAMTLKELGWVEGKNLAVERYYDEGRMDRLPVLADELVRKHVDVIYAAGPEAAVDAARATKSIPIVFWGVAAPVDQGLVESYARPGRNVTGIAWHAGTAQIPKLLEFVRQVSSTTRRIAYFSFRTAMRTVAGGYSDELDRHMESEARKLGLDLRSYPIFRQDDFDPAFKAMLEFRAQALITPTTWLAYLERKRIVDFANDNRLIGLFDTKQFVDLGGLLSYGPKFRQMHERAASFVDRILRGARPGDLPVEQPMTFELAVNLKSAQRLGITVPSSLLVRADNLVE